LSVQNCSFVEKRLRKNRGYNQHSIQGEEKITLENDIELFILKSGIVTYADIANCIKVSD
jgi:hypothetical protein